jgi:hypothetical protein
MLVLRVVAEAVVLRARALVVVRMVEQVAVAVAVLVVALQAMFVQAFLGGQQAPVHWLLAF